MRDRKTILVVDDEHEMIDMIRQSLEREEWRLITTTSCRQALSILREHNAIDLLITDLFMPEMDGARLLKKGREIIPGLRAVLLTGLASDEECIRWRRRGETVVLKPWPEEEFVAVVTKSLAL